MEAMWFLRKFSNRLTKPHRSRYLFGLFGGDRLMVPVDRTEVDGLTFTQEAAEHVISAFGWEVTNKGYIWADDAVMSITGQPVHIGDLAGVVEYNGEPRPLRDDFNELVEYVKYRHEDELEADDG